MGHLFSLYFVSNGSRPSPKYEKASSRSAGTTHQFFGSSRTNAESMQQNDQAFTGDAEVTTQLMELSSL